MTIKGNKGGQFFHGTKSELSSGELLTPTTPGYGTDELHSFATNNPEYASLYGDQVYVVSPEDEVHEDPYNDDPEAERPEIKSYSSRRLRVMRKL